MDKLEILKKYWGYEEFRPLQPEIIQSVIDGKDTIALLPTGGGKSICYQIPALILKDGLTIVISPLLALMDDQVRILKERKIEASKLNSTMNARQIDNTKANIRAGKIKILYLSPEKFYSKDFIDFVKDIKLSLIAVDEAHCISAWGFDFRPSYLQIHQGIKQLAKVPIIALTATATKAVLADIKTYLNLDKANLFTKSFLRENIHFYVRHSERKYEELLYFSQKMKGSGIIYVNSRRETNKISDFLNQYRISASYFHAGLSVKEKRSVQERWINNEIKIIVCTNAFGMGIDKGDVQFVLHASPPTSLEAYYQEAGRAGRNGAPSFAIALYNSTDFDFALSNTLMKHSDVAELKSTYLSLCDFLNLATESGDYYQDFDLEEFVVQQEGSFRKIRSALKYLEKLKLIAFSNEQLDSCKIQVLNTDFDNIRQQPNGEILLKVIQLILRSYEGLFVGPVSIKLIDLSKKLEISSEQLKACLSELDRQNYISVYLVESQQQIRIVNGRQAKNRIKIDINQHQENLQRDLKRIDRIKEYFVSKECRQRIILNYFNEQLHQDCGKCDICLGAHIESFTSSEQRKFKSNILEKLKMGPIKMNSIIYSFSMNKHKRVINLLKEMAEEEIIIIEKNFIRLKN